MRPSKATVSVGQGSNARPIDGVDGPVRAVCGDGQCVVPVVVLPIIQPRRSRPAPGDRHLGTSALLRR